MSTLYRKAFSGTVWVAAAKAVSLGIGVFYPILLTRYLSVDEYGSYRFIFTLSSVLGYFTSLGLEAAIGRFVPELQARGRYGAIRSLVGRFSLVKAGSLLLLLGAALLAQDRVAAFFNFTGDLRKWYLAIFLYIVVSQTHLVFGAAFLNATLEQRVTSLVEIAATFGRFALLLAIVKLDLGFRAIVMSLILVEGATFAFYLARWVLRRAGAGPGGPAEAGYPAAPEEDRVEWRRVTRFAGWSYLLSATGVFRELTIDNMIIAHFLDMTQVGLYSFAITLITLLNNLNPGMVLKNLISYVFVRKFVASGDPASMARGNALIVKLCSFVLIPAYLATAVLLLPVIEHLFSPEFLPAVKVIRWMMAFFLVQNCFIYGLGHVFSTLELVGVRILGSVLVSIYNIGLEIYLVPRIGIEGAAIATGSAALLMCLYYYVVIKYRLRISLPFPALSVSRIALNAGAAVAPAWLLLPHIGGVPSLLSAAALSAALYMGLSLINRPFEASERELINGAVGRKVWFF